MNIQTKTRNGTGQIITQGEREREREREDFTQANVLQAEGEQKE